MARIAKAAKLVLIFAGIVVLFGQESLLDRAAAAFQQGRAAEASQALDSFLKEHPADLRALILKGAVLDSLQQYAEAESYYQRAQKLAPASAQVLNNTANHYLASGDQKRARELYLKVIAIDPKHVNANLQLAQMAVDEKRGGEALAYLNRLGDTVSADAGAQLLRARALALAGRCTDATALLGKIEAQPGAGPNIYFSTGMAFSACKQYDQAETAFSRALDAGPKDFTILYNLGLAALGAGHTERAATTLETALQERPEDVDCLYALAETYLKQDRLMDAAGLLAKAQKLAPQRADVLLLLAQVSQHLEFYEDAAAAYTRYLKLKPEDAAARRERGMALACAGQFSGALADLGWYVRTHPRDAIGFYELAVAEHAGDRAKGLAALDRALALDPSMAQAHYTRAVFNIEDQKPAAAIDDLRLVVEHDPANYRVLVHLGQAYLGADRVAEAADVLKRAVDLSPAQPAALVQYHNALAKLGRAEEAAAVLARLKQAGSEAQLRKPQAGLIDYLSLSPREQRARYLANLRKYAESNGDDPRWKLRLARELFADGNITEAQDVFRSLRPAVTDAEMLALCGRTLVEFEQYAEAREFLELALSADPSLSTARLDLAITRFHLQNAAAGLGELDKTPAAGRQGDYYLLRAQLLDAQGKMQEAADALNQGIRAAPTKPDLYMQAAGFLLKHKLYHEALDLLQQASRVLPDARDLLLAQAVTSELLHQSIDAQKILAKIEAHWPEWDRPYLLSGILLEIQLKSAEAREALETAIALGANTPEAYYYQALAITHAVPDDLDSAEKAITHAMALTDKDPTVYLLAGKIALAKKDYPVAIRRLLTATNLQRTLIPAHYALRDAYKALGDTEKSTAELEEIKRLAAENPPDDQNPFSIQDFLFEVRPPS